MTFNFLFLSIYWCAPLWPAALVRVLGPEPQPDLPSHTQFFLSPASKEISNTDFPPSSFNRFSPAIFFIYQTFKCTATRGLSVCVTTRRGQSLNSAFKNYKILNQTLAQCLNHHFRFIATFVDTYIIIMTYLLL